MQANVSLVQVLVPFVNCFLLPAQTKLGGKVQGAVQGGAHTGRGFASEESKGSCGDRVVLRDGVHLFQPRAAHHALLAREGATSHAPGTASYPSSSTHSLLPCPAFVQVVPSVWKKF